MTRILIALLIASFFLAASAIAEIPRTVSIQGYLTDEDGAPVPDGSYDAIFMFYDAPDAGSLIHETEEPVTIADGVFSHVLVLPANAESFFQSEVWVEITFYQGGTMQPRVRMTASPYALRAAVADSLAGGSSGIDDDWVIEGDDIYRLQGKVYIGTTPRGELPSPRAPGDRTPADYKVLINDSNRGLFGRMVEIDNLQDRRAAIYGQRTRTTPNEGGGFGELYTNTAVTGYNEWGDSYTFGVAGYTWHDNPHTAGVLGSVYDGTYWAALGYLDTNFTGWGLYTLSDARIGGVAELGGLRIPAGAASGYVLACDAAGNASWQPPGSVGSDGDWTVSGDHLYHDTGGTVALGTDTPRPMIAGDAALQVEGMYYPSILLDVDDGAFSRWAIYNGAYYGTLGFGHTTSTSGIASAAMTLTASGRLALGGRNPDLYDGNLIVPGGNGNVWTSEGDLTVGDSGDQFRLGVFTSGALAGEVNMRANSSSGTATLHLGVDDHDVIRIGDSDVVFSEAGGDTSALIHTSEAGDLGGALSLYSSTYSSPIATLDAQSTAAGGGGILYLKQEAGLAGVYLRAQDATYGGGQLKLYNGSGLLTLELDAHHSVSGTSRVTTDALEITGGADLSEQFDVREAANGAEPGQVVCIDPEHPGRLALSEIAYDRRVAGVISGAGNISPGMLMGQQNSVADGEHPVALAGRVYVWADATAGAIVPGDLLTTSGTPGHAMRVDDHARAGGAVLGKAMTGLEEGRGLVLVLVSLQ